MKYFIAIIIASFIFTSDASAKACSLDGMQISDPKALKGLTQCAAGSALALTVIHNLKKAADNSGTPPSQHQDSPYSIVRTARDGACLQSFSNGMYESLTGINDARGKIVRDKGPKEFLLSVWAFQKDRVKDKTWRGDFIPELAGKGFKKVATATAGQDSLGAAVAGDLTDPVKVFTKIALAKQGDNTDKDVNALAGKIACGDTVNKIVEDLTPDKTSALSAIMRATKPINGVKSKGDDMLLYVDMATLLAMNGGELGKQIIDDTLAPALGSTKKWTLTQKAKAARLGLKLKRFVKKMEQQSVAAAEDAGNVVGDTKDGIVKRIDTGKEVVAQTQAELDQKLEEANQQYNEMTTMINDIIAEGQDRMAPPELRDYTSQLQLHWARFRHDREKQVFLLRERTKRMLCLAPDATLTETQLEEKTQICDSDDNTEEKPKLIDKAKSKIKSLWGKIKDRGQP